MKIYRFALALLCGAGLTCLVALVLGLSPSALPLGLFLAPGGIITEMIAGPKEFSPALPILAADSLIYSIIAYSALYTFARAYTAEKMRAFTIRLLLPVAIVVGLVCIPKLNPLRPSGFEKLTQQEKALQDALPVGAGVAEARVVLRSEGIQFGEDSATEQTVVLDDGRGTRILAGPGDHIISARLPTEARAFPCTYNIRIVLLVGVDETIRQQYIHRLRLCP